MIIDARLKTIAEMVRRGDRVADIGTDHAYLPIYMLLNGIASSCLACDITDGPLENARQNIEKLAINKIIVRQSDGFSNISPDEADSFVIAGMGGDAISFIIGKCDWIKHSKYQLILQPMSSVYDLREFLFNSGFDILEERGVTSLGRVYTVMKVQFVGIKVAATQTDKFLGKLHINSGEQEIKYIKRIKHILENQIKDMADAVHMTAKRDELCSVVAEIDEILRKYNGI